jgi:hypothetical protein
MSKQEAKPQAVPGAIRVETATTVQGRAATTISVEVEESRFGHQGEGANDARRAVALVPRTREGKDGKEGKQEWTEQELIQSGRRVTEDERVVKTFNATISGPDDISADGVSVRVETPGGTVWANDQKPMAARDADKAPAKAKS